MNLLILGGTYFLGRAIVEDALRRGDSVTLFNRGNHAGVFPNVEQLIGNRDGKMEALESEIQKGRKWDAAIDTSGYIPRIVKNSAEMLKHAVSHYAFVSSISVYDFSPELRAESPIDEHSPISKLENEQAERITNETYGALKALCEAAAESAMPKRVLNVRAGLIVGKYDMSGRFVYWVYRIAKGGRMLVPSDAPVQFIDARDLAKWLLNAIDQRLAGAFNVTGNFTRREVFETCKRVSESDALFIEVSDSLLLENDIAPYTELPLWLPKEYARLDAVEIQKALKAGLTFRPLSETIQETLDWLNAQTEEMQTKLLGASLKAEKEERILRKILGEN